MSALRLLHLEDNPGDAELIHLVLEAAGIDCESRTVDTRAGFLAEIAAASFDLILSDFSIPGFDGLAALAAARERDPEVPFIFVSGTIGEEMAIASLKSGATDYVLKENLSRLPTAVRRALVEARERRARRQAEEALAESRRLVERIVESTPNIVYVYDLAERRNVFSNREVAMVLGYTPDQIAANRDAFLETVTHPEDAQRVQERLARFEQAGGETIETEYRLRDAAGEWRWLHTRETVFALDADSRPRRILGVAEDVTQRKRAEQRWATQYDATRTLAESTTWDAAVPRMLECLCRRLGFDLGELWELDTASHLLRPRATWAGPGIDATDWIRGSQGMTFASGAGLPGRVWAQGRPLWIRDVRDDDAFLRKTLARDAGVRAAVAVPIRGAVGIPVQSAQPTPDMFAVMVLFGHEDIRRDADLELLLGALGSQIGDFRERKRAEEKIRDQAALLENAQEAVLVEDLDRHVTYWNPAAERMYVCSAAEAMTHGVAELLHEGNPAQVYEARTRVLQEGAWSGVLDQRTKGGRELVVQSHWTLIRDGTGRPTSVLVINTDVTEAKRLEAKFMRAQRMESIGALAGGIAHDLNNVLSPILMSLEILRRKITDDQGQRILATLETSTRRGADLVRQVLTFARGNEGERALLQPGHLVREMEKIARETFPKSITVRVDVSADLWTVSGQPTPLHQVLMNLCVNARDAMAAEGGTLTVRAENVHLDATASRRYPGARPGPYVLLSVADTGTGIPPDLMDRIFDPFFTTKRTGSGTGLGLYTSVSIVKSHGGFMDVYAEEGHGANFKVYLPALPGGHAQGPESALPPLPRGSGEVVLVVDDEASVREIAREILEGHGYRTLVAKDGSEAVRLYARAAGEVRIVLTDLAMPIMDGAATVRALRALDPHLKVVAASGLGSGPRVAEAESLGVQAFLAKPYTALKLLETVRAVLLGV